MHRIYRHSQEDDVDDNVSEVSNNSSVAGDRTKSMKSSSSLVCGQSVIDESAMPHYTVMPANNRFKHGSIDRLSLRGPMTLELIADFLDPINRTRPPEMRPSMNCLELETATGGYGLIKFNNSSSVSQMPRGRDFSISSIDSASTAIDDVTMRLKKMVEKYEKEEEEEAVSYQRIREEFEHELKSTMFEDAQYQDENNVKKEFGIKLHIVIMHLY